MSKEFSWKRTTSRLSMVVLALFSGIQYLNRPPSQRAWEAYNSLPKKCADVMPNLAHYDIIAVFGAGQDGNKPNGFQLERLMAAASAYVAGYSDKILLIDGGDEEVQNFSVTYLIQATQHLSYNTITLPTDKIYFIEESINTADNMGDLHRYMDLNGYTSALGITNYFHEPRVDVLSENYGVNLDVVPTECMGEKYYPKESPDLEKRSMSENMINMTTKEKYALLELVVDPKGYLTIIRKKLMQDNLWFD